MKISQKLSIGFAAIATPITLFSILMIGSVGNELKEVGDFHSPNLYLIQNYATKTTEAVGESFAYVASGDQSEKEAFLLWAKEIEATKQDFAKAEFVSQKEEKNRRGFKKIILKQTELVKKAKELFNEFESKGSVSSNLFNEYKLIVNQLTNNYKKAIELEKMKVDKEQRRAINLIKQTLKNIVLLGVLTIISSIFSGYFIAITFLE